MNPELNKLISRVFKARNAAHASHWTTKSFAQHEALGDFYEDVISSLDKVVEAHQGTFGQMPKAPEQLPDIAKVLREDLVWINDNRGAVAMQVPGLENLLDELAGVYMRALYKLENLR